MSAHYVTVTAEPRFVDGIEYCDFHIEVKVNGDLYGGYSREDEGVVLDDVPKVNAKGISVGSFAFQSGQTIKLTTSESFEAANEAEEEDRATLG